MKKLFCFLIIFLLFIKVDFLFAQKGIYIGFKGGVNVANNYGADYTQKSTDVIGFAGSLTTQLAFAKGADFSRFSLMFDLGFLPMGNNMKEDSIKTKLSYFTFAVKPRFFYGLLGKANSGFYVEAGPYASLLASAKSKTEDENVDIKDLYNPYDYGVAMGGGWAFTGMFSVCFNYNLGLSHIAKQINNVDVDVRNQSWGIYLNLAIPVKN